MAQQTKRRLLLIAAEVPPRGGGGVLRVTKLVKYLAQLGWEITVVCSDEPPGETNDETLLRELSAGAKRIIRVRGPLRGVGATARKTVEATRSKRGGGWIWDTARTVARAVAVPDRWIGWSLKVGRLSAGVLGDPEVIVSSGPPHSAHLAAHTLSRRLGIPFVMDLRDDWAGNPLFASRAPWRDPVDRLLERRTMGSAAATVVVSEASKIAYGSRYPSLLDRVQVIPNGFDPHDLPEFSGRSGRDDGRVHFLHPGSLRYDRAGGHLLFAAFGAAVRSDPSLELHLLGSVSPSNAARAEAEIPANSLSIDGFVPHDEALRRMAGADVLVVISSTTEAGAGTMTAKIYECLAVRRPILLISPPGPAADLIDSSGSGVVVGPSSRDDLARAIAQTALLAKSPDFIGAPPEVLERFDRRRQAGVWSVLLDSCS